MEEANSNHTTRNSSNCFCCRELISLHNFSFKKFCFFLFVFFVIAFVIIGLSTFFVIIIIKPHKPVFSVREVKMDFYELDDNNDRNHNNSLTTILLSSVLSLTLNAENHNKFGLGFSPARFHVYDQGFPIGTIRIPRFFQPPHSDDVVVRCRVLLECVNVSKMLAKASKTTGDDESNGNVSEIKILGDAKAHLWFFHLNLLTIKLAMDCDMNVDLKDITTPSKNEVHSVKRIKRRLAYALSNSKATTMKCVSALSI